MAASVSLSYVAAMQEHGVPVTYAYISDAHDAHPSGPAYGPGQAGYVAALASYDAAFAKFFARLAADGIDKSNTLFVFTSDEGDRFVGGPPSPAGCDGVMTPCAYSKIGEISGNLAGLLATERGNKTPFKVHSDDAPTVYITGNPAQTADVTRKFERDVAAVTALNPYTGNMDTLTQTLADQVEMKLLHMVTADPARTPTFTMFADPNYFLFAGAPNCSSPCSLINPGFAWNHGDTNPEITTTWLGLAGPGIRNLGVTADVWSDHTDIRPTTLSLVGLMDDYSSDGRVLVEPLYDWAVPPSLRAHHETVIRLAQAYKQINAPVGGLGLATLRISTQALESSSTNDQTYTDLESRLATLTAQRNALAGTMSAMLRQAAFDGMAINEQDAQEAIAQAQTLLQSAGA
jgi:arylsulfatase A-like enzyme